MEEACKLVHKAAKTNKITLSEELSAKLEKLQTEANFVQVNKSI
jgi:hypothetical protein